MGELTAADEEVLNAKIYEAMVYKAGTVELSLWSDCCKMDFKKRDPQYGPKFIKRVESIAIILMGL